LNGDSDKLKIEIVGPYVYQDDSSSNLLDIDGSGETVTYQVKVDFKLSKLIE
jgi:hypothetical protein